MILKNYDSIIQSLTMGNERPTGAYDSLWANDYPGIVRASNGSYYYNDYTFGSSGAFGGSNSVSDNNATLSKHVPTLLVGNGNSDVSYDDYDIARITSLTVSGFRGNSITHDTETCKLVTTKTFINNTSEDITVTEVGIYAATTGYQRSGSTTYSYFTLIYREKLAEPVTLPANGGKATFSVTVNVPLMNKPST